MKKIKLIEQLYSKAKENGQAKMNGRMRGMWGHVGELEEKYAIEIENDILTMRHWGTETIAIDLVNNNIIEYYGESNSDRDSLNTLVNALGIEPNFRYLPSKDKFFYDENLGWQIKSSIVI